MKNLWTAFQQSLKLPQKNAVFSLNRIGMDTTVFYLFILIAFVSLPELINQIIADKTAGFNVHIVFILIYFFIFYYLMLLLIVFIALSIIAYISLIISRGLKRKLHYSILWKMSAFATTIPLLLYTIISFFYSLSYFYLTLATIFIFFILIKIILIYPKRRDK